MFWGYQYAHNNTDIWVVHRVYNNIGYSICLNKANGDVIWEQTSNIFLPKSSFL